jgi:pSer/pThr/pTyr-binding forkhead associated (FHA) protein
VARFRLRYQAIDVDLKAGDFTVGRHPDCSLVLDDARVSRTHAVFRVSGNTVVVEDLGSRNGVRVNGRKITEPTALKPGDKTRIGSQELVLRDAAKGEGGIKADVNTRTVKIRICQDCNLPYEADARQCPHCKEARLSSTTRGDGDSDGTDGGERPSPPRGQYTASSINLITNIVDKAISMGQYDEAERLVTGILDNVLAEADSSPANDRVKIEITAHYVLRIAAATQRPQWVDSVFALYQAAGDLMPAETIDSLYGLFNTLRYSNTVPLRSYLARLRAKADAYGPSERFLLQRIEGLERLALSK